MWEKILLLFTDYFFLCVISIITLSSVLYEHPQLTDIFRGTTSLYYLKTHPVLCRSLSHSTLQIPQSTEAWLMEKKSETFIHLCWHTWPHFSVSLTQNPRWSRRLFQTSVGVCHTYAHKLFAHWDIQKLSRSLKSQPLLKQNPSLNRVGG